MATERGEWTHDDVLECLNELNVLEAENELSHSRSSFCLKGCDDDRGLGENTTLLKRMVSLISGLW